ncbi:MAG: beta-propeller domain-containing protein, partial [Patescibacteria group bacterium]
MSKKSFQFALLLVLMVFLASGCTPPWKKPAAPPSLIPDDSTSGEDAVPSSDTSTKIAQLKKFNNYEELAKFLAEHDNPDSSSVLVNSRSAEMGISGTAAGGKMISTAAPMASESFDQSADNAAGDISQPSASLDYSSTNNQVAGVDEADIIKTDGQYIYALVRSELSIIQAAPADEAKVISKITFKSRPQDIFIKDNYLAVFGSDEQIYAQPLYRSFRRQNPYAFFKVFDLTDRTNPKLVRDLDFEGSYYDARLIGDYVYFITNTYGNYVAKEPLIPRVLDSGQVLPLKCEGVAKCFAPDVFYFDVPYDYYNFTNITAINIKNNGEALGGQVYLLNSGQNLYVSQDNIYITYTQYLNEYDLEQTVKRELVFP